LGPLRTRTGLVIKLSVVLGLRYSERIRLLRAIVVSMTKVADLQIEL
jgi:hypothetical protein